MDRRTIQITQYNEQNISTTQDISIIFCQQREESEKRRNPIWPELEKALKGARAPAQVPGRIFLREPASFAVVLEELGELFPGHGVTTRYAHRGVKDGT